MRNKLIFSNTSAKILSKKVAKEANSDLGRIALQKFSSNEIYVEFLENVADREIYIIGTAGENPNDDVMEILLMIDAAKRAFAKQIHLILPYFPYCRQDKKFSKPSPISASLMARMFEMAGASTLFTITLHDPCIEGYFSIPTKHIYTDDLFGNYFKSKNIKNPVLVAPDEGAAKWVSAFAKRFGFDYAIVNKMRPEKQKSPMMDIIGDVKGKTAILFDDIVDTGSTLIQLKKSLLAAGVDKNVYVAVTHPVLGGPGKKNVARARFKEFIATDTIPLPMKKRFRGLKILSVAGVIADYINYSN
ncbi:MAG: hypothetical protein ACD_63C00024G0007 [uncultured bacterium]|nr:MAG: hypothetical protein ACD_63C00024G0007 [uncultured bacterium]